MSSRPGRAVRRALTAIVPVTALLTLAACGNGTTPAADSTQAAAPGLPGLSAARAALAKYSERPATISVTQPVGKQIPKGKKIDFILCGVQSCKDLADFFTDAAGQLGWQVKQIATQGTPESVQAAYEQALRDKPDAVVASGFPRAVYAKQLAQLKAAGIPVIQSNADDVVGDGISLLKNGPKDVGRPGRDARLMGGVQQRRQGGHRLLRSAGLHDPQARQGRVRRQVQGVVRRLCAGQRRRADHLGGQGHAGPRGVVPPLAPEGDPCRLLPGPAQRGRARPR